MPFFSAAAMYCASAMAGRAVDRHRGGDVAHVDAVEEHFHVGQRVDRDAALADFAARLRRVGVVAHERRHVERDREPVLTLLAAGNDTARWSAWRCRSRRTGASSRAGRGSRWDGCRAYRETRRVREIACQAADPRRPADRRRLLAGRRKSCGRSHPSRDLRGLPLAEARSQRRFCSSNSGVAGAPKPLGRSIILANSVLFSWEVRD